MRTTFTARGREGDPAVVAGSLQRRDRGTFPLEARIASVLLPVSIALPWIGEAHSTREAAVGTADQPQE